MGGCANCKKEVKNTKIQKKEEIEKDVNELEKSSPSKSPIKRKVTVKFDVKSLISENNYFFQHYKIVKLIGEGAFGKIHKVIHNESGMFRAMKTIKKSYVTKQDDEKKFLKEIEILQNANHPHIIKIYEYFVDSVNFYLIIEYMNKGDLLHAIEESEVFSEATASIILKQLFSAVSYMHSNKMVHRDIKPENILVSEFDTEKGKINIKLSDFGTSNYFNKDHNFLKKRVGSPYYIAPEILNKQYNEKCDIWSCGVLMYFLLTGDMPFNASSPDELRAKIQVGVFDTKSSSFTKISKEAQNLILKLLNKDFLKRISAEEAIGDPWFKKFEDKNTINVNEVNLIKALDNIKSFKINDKLQLVGIAFIVHFIESNDEIAKLVEIFKGLDKNGDGKLSFNELKESMIKVKGQYWTEIEMMDIFQKIDQDKNGYIDYEEFIRVSIDKNSILSEKNLKLAFNNFDRNKDGTLTSEDIKIIFGNEENEYCCELMKSIDENNGGKIDFTQFCDLMKKIMNNKSKKCLRKSKTLNENTIKSSFKANQLKITDLEIEDKEETEKEDISRLTTKKGTKNTRSSNTSIHLLKVQNKKSLFMKDIEEIE